MTVSLPRLRSGANVIVAGTAVFHAENPRDVIHFLRTRCDEAQKRISAQREAAEASSQQGGSDSKSSGRKFAEDAMVHGAGVSTMSQPKTYFDAGIRDGSEAPPIARQNATSGNKP